MNACGQSNGENQQVNALIWYWFITHELNFNFELKKLEKIIFLVSFLKHNVM